MFGMVTLNTLLLLMSILAGSVLALLKVQHNKVYSDDSLERICSGDYTQFENSAIKGHNTETIILHEEPPADCDGCPQGPCNHFDVCAEKCSERDWCKSFDYRKLRCSLSDVQAPSVTTKTEYDHYLMMGDGVLKVPEKYNSQWYSRQIVLSEAECQQACRDDKNRQQGPCTSFDILKPKCYLSDKSRTDVGLKNDYTDNPYDHYERAVSSIPTPSPAPAAAAPAPAAGSSSNSALQGVIAVMEELEGKSKSDQTAENAEYIEYAHWCDMEIREKTLEIKQATTSIEELEAKVGVQEDISAQITAKKEEIDELQHELDEALAVHSKEKRAFHDAFDSYSEQITVLENALEALGSQSSSPSLIQDDPEPITISYENAGEGIISTLEYLKEKFIDARAAEDTAFQDNANAYNTLESEKKQSIQTCQQELASLEADYTQSAFEQELSEAKARKKGDEKYLATITADCTQMASEFESRQEIRGVEVNVLQKAMEILENLSEKGSGEAEIHLPAL